MSDDSQLNVDLTKFTYDSEESTLRFKVVSQYSKVLNLSKAEIILFRSSVCASQRMKLFLDEDGAEALALCVKLKQLEDENRYMPQIEATLSDKQLQIIQTSLSFIAMQTSLISNRLNIVLNSSQRVES